MRSGPRPAKIMLIGEALGEQEERLGQPFVGGAGQELTRMLREAGIDRGQCYITNVFWRRPPNNKVHAFCGSKKEVGGSDYPYPPLASGKYVRPEIIQDVSEKDARELGLDYIPRSIFERLRIELDQVRPNVVVALGNTPCWALLGMTKITQIRGTVAQGLDGYKVLPTFHPAYILRSWGDRPIALADFMKARHEAEFPEVRLPRRKILIDPTIEEVEEWADELVNADILSFDIETGHGMISVIGFADTADCARVVPFVDRRREGWSYWETIDRERRAWAAVRRILASPAPKLAQGGLYDLQYLWRAGIPVNNYAEDTMVIHHALQPELPKSLGFLGSIYTNEASWKLLRPRGDESNKRDE